MSLFRKEKPLKTSKWVKDYLVKRMEHWEDMRKNFNKYFSHLTGSNKQFMSTKIYGQRLECQVIAEKLGVKVEE
jgi:hypothetical protein